MLNSSDVGAVQALSPAPHLRGNRMMVKVTDLHEGATFAVRRLTRLKVLVGGWMAREGLIKYWESVALATLIRA